MFLLIVVTLAIATMVSSQSGQASRQQEDKSDTAFSVFVSNVDGTQLPAGDDAPQSPPASTASFKPFAECNQGVEHMWMNFGPSVELLQIPGAEYGTMFDDCKMYCMYQPTCSATAYMSMYGMCEYATGNVEMTDLIEDTMYTTATCY